MTTQVQRPSATAFPRAPQHGKPERSRARLSIAVVAAVVLAGLLKLAEPLGGDQSLFLVGAQAMHHGASLYRDFWDLKQPAIYFFYYLATAYEPYSAIATHATELIYLACFSLILIAALRKSTTFRSVAEFVPLSTIVFYYLTTTSFEAIQVESLVGFPLFATLCSFSIGSQSARRSERLSWYFFGGVAAAIVLSFKLLFAPIVVGLWLASIVVNVRTLRTPALVLAQSFAATTVGFLMVAALIILPFEMNGTAALAFETWFTIPAAIVRHVPHQTASMLLNGARWFIDRYAAMIVLAIVGAIVALRSKPDAFAIGALAWIATAIVVILVQVTSWFQYQWLLLIVPLGMLASLGARTLIKAAFAKTNPTLERTLAMGLFIISSILVPAFLFVRAATPLVRSHLALSSLDRESYRRAVSYVYASLQPEAKFITPETATLYVIGDPSLYVIARRSQPVRLNGSSVRLFLPGQWRALAVELRQAAPTFLFISSGITIDSPDVRQLIDRDYRLKHRGKLGILFTRAATATTTNRGVVSSSPT